MTIFSNIGDVVRFHRKRAGLSQAVLANLCGVGKTVVYDLEKNKKSIQCDTLLKILHALNIRIRLESPLMNEFREKEDAQSKS